MSAPSPKSFLTQIINGRSRLKPAMMGTSGRNPISRSKWPIGMGPHNVHADPNVFKERYEIYKNYHNKINPNKSMSTGYKPYSLSVINAITARKENMTRESNYSNFTKSGASFGRPNKRIAGEYMNVI